MSKEFMLPCMSCQNQNLFWNVMLWRRNVVLWRNIQNWQSPKANFRLICYVYPTWFTSTHSFWSCHAFITTSASFWGHWALLRAFYSCSLYCSIKPGRRCHHRRANFVNMFYAPVVVKAKYMKPIPMYLNGWAKVSKRNLNLPKILIKTSLFTFVHLLYIMQVYIKSIMNLISSRWKFTLQYSQYHDTVKIRLC